MVGHRIPLVPALAGVGLLAYLFPSVVVGVPRLRPLFGVRDRTAAGTGVGLTFDDGPHAQGTPAVLDVLATAGATATFFLVGEQVERNPRLAAEILAAGHEVGLHCHRHRSLLRLTPGQLRDDLRRARSAIGAATGVSPRLYRPPYGIFNAAAFGTVRQIGCEPILWTRDGRDWEEKATAESITARVTRDIADGDVLLLHDADDYGAPGSWRTTASALPTVLAEIEHRGLETASL
jgi:peptidoglycan/xylan/chitin deacetylase (PgdA/CDA1 family)